MTQKKIAVKKVLFILIALLPSISVLAQELLNGPQITIEETTYQFDDLYQGESTEHTFEFENTGTSPLIINSVLSTCGCTIPEWPKEPIKPGEKGSIKVVFDSTGKLGRQNKIITIRSNAEDGETRLKISGMVLPPKKD